MEAMTIAEQAREKLVKALKDAQEKNDTEAATKALQEFFSDIEKKIKKMAADTANEIAEGKSADIALAKRGVRILTPEETNYFKSFAEHAKNKTLTDFNDAIPTTVIEAVFEGLAQKHEILKHIRFVNTGALTKFVYNAANISAAAWGELTTAITKEIVGSFKTIDLNLAKLSAFMVISNDMLDLGPVWIERYVRECLVEAISGGVDKAVATGKGIKGEPIGMTKNLNGSINQTTGLPDKDPIAITDLGVETYGDLLSGMAETPEGVQRDIEGVIIVANPKTFFKRILPAITMLTLAGEYARVVPYPTSFVKSTALEDDQAIFGIDNTGYIMGLGSRKNGKIEKSEDAQFLEDCTVYKTKLYGAGQPIDNNCFKLLDVSGLEPLALRIHNDVASATSTTETTDDEPDDGQG